MLLDLTGVSGSLLGVSLVGMRWSAMMTSSLSQVMSFSTQVLYTAVLCSQMLRSTDCGSDLTTDHQKLLGTFRNCQRPSETARDLQKQVGTFRNG